MGAAHSTTIHFTVDIRQLCLKHSRARLTELNKIEDETDELETTLARALFKHEDDLKPVSVMMWYQIIEWIADLADYAEKVGDHLRLLIAK